MGERKVRIEFNTMLIAFGQSINPDPGRVMSWNMPKDARVISMVVLPEFRVDLIMDSAEWAGPAEGEQIEEFEIVFTCAVESMAIYPADAEQGYLLVCKNVHCLTLLIKDLFHVGMACGDGRVLALSAVENAQKILEDAGYEWGDDYYYKKA